jgi:toxin ParE1/3/4
LTAAYRWISNDNKAAAKALREAVKAATVQIAEHPYFGRSDPGMARAPYRLLPLRGFPYILIYNPEREPPAIVRIVHGARDLPEVLSDL